jgi:MFS family permease
LKETKESGGFDWDAQEQGMVLGAFYYGFFVSMLPGGFLAERYGGRWVILFSVLGGSLISLIQPFAANEGGSTYFILSRAIQGLLMVTYDCLFCLSHVPGDRR